MVMVISRPKTMIVPCPVCSGKNYSLVSRLGTYLFPINLSVCNQCGFVFQNPRVSEQCWEAYYETGVYDTVHRPLSPENETNCCRAAIDVHKRVTDFMSRKNDMSQTGDGRLRVCEIGAGHGDIIDLFKGADLFALEPSEDCQIALKQKGISLIGKSIGCVEANLKKSFDVVLMRHVLEHVYDPKRTMGEVASLLKDRGILYVAVPNVLIRDYMSHCTYPHISHFSKHSLIGLLRSSSLEADEGYEEKDEIWCLARKIGTRDQVSVIEDKVWMSRNLQETRHSLRYRQNFFPLLRRSLVRIFSNLIPRRVLSDTHIRRNRNKKGC